MPSLNQERLKMEIKNRLLEGILIVGGLVGSVYVGVNGAIEQYGRYNCESKRAEITNELVNRGLANNLKEQELYPICKQIKNYQSLEKKHASNARDYSELAVPAFASLITGTLLNRRRKNQR